MKNVVVSAAVLVLLSACQVQTGDGGGDVDYPTKPVSLVIPSPAGSGPDTTFRKLAEIAERDLGTSVVIVNQPGGDGSVGAAAIADAKADGYTVGQVASAQLHLLPRVQDTAYEGVADFDVLAAIDTAPGVLVVSADSPLRTVDDLADADGGLKLGQPGKYNIPDLQSSLLRREIDADLDTVTFDPGQQVPAVVNGTVDVALAQPGAVMQFIEAGRLRPLGVIGTEPVPGIDAPLLSESGYDVDIAADEYVVAPSGLSGPVKEKLTAAFLAAARSTEFRSFAESSGVVPVPADGRDALKQIEAEDARFAALIDDLGWKTR